jgi:hypothetical protein
MMSLSVGFGAVGIAGLIYAGVIVVTLHRRMIDYIPVGIESMHFPTTTTEAERPLVVLAVTH